MQCFLCGFENISSATWSQIRICFLAENRSDMPMLFSFFCSAYKTSVIAVPSSGDEREHIWAHFVLFVWTRACIHVCDKYSIICYAHLELCKQCNYDLVWKSIKNY